MSKLSGLFLIVAGIGAAAYVMPTSETSTERRLADVVQIATNATALPGSQAQPDNKTARFAAPKLIAVREGRTDPANSAQLPATKGGAVIAQAVAPPLAPSNGVPGGRVTVVPSNNPVAQIVPPAPQPVVRRATAPRPGDPDARANLAREIQRELKRVGCYDGDVSAEWSPAAKRAMKSFTDRVNATLPVDEPDHILLTLVQGQSSRACGRSCPTGQSPANDGRCLPTAVLAQVAKRPTQADAGQPAALVAMLCCSAIYLS